MRLPTASRISCAVLLASACTGNISIGNKGLSYRSGGSDSVGGGTVSISTGGTVAAAGTTNPSQNAGVGCTSNFETNQSGTGLCIAKMTAISAPSGYSDYSIDVTEVTHGQYEAWVATHPALPPKSDANCGYVTSYAENGSGSLPELRC